MTEGKFSHCFTGRAEDRKADDVDVIGPSPVYRNSGHLGRLSADDTRRDCGKGEALDAAGSSVSGNARKQHKINIIVLRTKTYIKASRGNYDECIGN